MMKKIFWAESGAAFDFKASERVVVRSAVSFMMTKLKKGSEYSIETDTGVRSGVLSDCAGTKMLMSKFEFSAEISVF